MSPREEEVKAELASSPVRPNTATSTGRSAFIKLLNSRLPTKRLIAQGLMRDEAGRVLLCETTYKTAWDLPGGVVDPGESPAACLVRELEEELGLAVASRGLVAVDWLPPYRGWDDALLVLFDLGRFSEQVAAQMVLQPREIRGVHWVESARLAEVSAPYTARLVGQVLEHDPVPGMYLEDSAVVLPGVQQ